MGNPKIGEDGVRLCDQPGCELPATHAYVWDKPMVACILHAQMALQIANMMGFPTPANTLRELEIDEMFASDDK